MYTKDVAQPKSSKKAQVKSETKPKVLLEKEEAIDNLRESYKKADKKTTESALKKQFSLIKVPDESFIEDD